MDAILQQLEKRNASRALLAPAVAEAPPDPALVKAMEEARVAQEKHVKEVAAYRDKVNGHMRRLMESDHKWTQYPPLDTEHRYVVAQAAEGCGLVSHEFGEEGIDRFIVVYKPEHQPDDTELARMGLKYNEKLDDAAIERILSAKPEENDGEPPVQPKRPRQKKGAAEEGAEVVVVEKLHAVGTVKRVRRGTADAIEEIRLKKAREKSQSVDSLFEPKDE
jgi:hypothetical protein